MYEKFLLAVATFTYLCPLHVSAQFPRVCLSVATLTRKECCPVPRGFKQKCGEPIRGKCRDLEVENWKENFYYYDPMHEYDDRVNWPTVFFNRSCHCNDKFDGFDCGKCAYGRHGKNCEFFRTKVRRNIKHLNPKNALKFQKYLKLARLVRSPYQVANMYHSEMKSKDGRLKPSFLDVSVYDYHVWIHHYSATDAFGISLKHPGHPNLSHNGQGFLTWHRKFLLSFERDLQEISGDRSFTIPYWDWSRNQSCDICNEMYAGKTDSNGSVTGRFIRDWYSVCDDEIPDICDVNKVLYTISRNPNDSKQALPLPREIDFIMRFPIFDRFPYDTDASCCFRNLLEGNLDTKTALPSSEMHLHNVVHNSFGGTMSDVSVAPNDPIFWLHHSFVDRIFEKWLRRYRAGPSALTYHYAPFGHNRKSAIVPFFPISTHEDMFKKSFGLGYTYEDVDKNGYSSTDGDQEPARRPWQCKI